MTRATGSAAVRRILGLPVIGFTPWIVLAVVDGPGRVALAAGLACALAIATTVTGVAVGMRPKLLEVTGIVLFGVTLLVAVVVPGTRHWLEAWATEIANAAIALITVGSIIARRPFTLAYARETTDREHWDSPLFIRVNVAISSAWAIAFVASAIVGAIGDGPLHEPHDVWTNWVIQIALVVAAIVFTDWYPNHAIGRYASDDDLPPT